MTENRNLKRAVRARAAKTGESYTAALRHVRPAGPVQPQDGPAAGEQDPGAPRRLRLAVAQSHAPGDPRDTAGLRAAGAGIRQLMREARAAGARLVHFPEGAACGPHKRALFPRPDEPGPADWSRLDAGLLRAELTALQELAAGLRLWTVLGSVHPLTPPHRPHNSLYVISDAGTLVTRYDERFLSQTKLSYLYSPGAEPVTFTVDGLRFGCALGMETHFPEVFAEYERLEADCVLFSTHGAGVPVNAGPMAAEASGHAAANSFWVSYSATADDAVNAPSGIIDPEGRWAARGPAQAVPALAVADLEVAESFARPWRRQARSGIYAEHLVHDDARSRERTAF
jgi:predicted amidohydrolase